MTKIPLPRRRLRQYESGKALEVVGKTMSTGLMLTNRNRGSTGHVNRIMVSPSIRRLAYLAGPIHLSPITLGTSSWLPPVMWVPHFLIVLIANAWFLSDHIVLFYRPSYVLILVPFFFQSFHFYPLVSFYVIF